MASLKVKSFVCVQKLCGAWQRICSTKEPRGSRAVVKLFIYFCLCEKEPGHGVDGFAANFIHLCEKGRSLLKRSYTHKKGPASALRFGYYKKGALSLHRALHDGRPGFPGADGRRTLHRAPVGQGPPGPDWLAISFGFWSGRALATGTAWAGLCLIIHHHHGADGRSPIRQRCGRVCEFTTNFIHSNKGDTGAFTNITKRRRRASPACL